MTPFTSQTIADIKPTIAQMPIKVQNVADPKLPYMLKYFYDSCKTGSAKIDFNTAGSEHHLVLIIA